MKLEKMSDNKLIKLYMSGNEVGLSILIDRYQEKIYTSIYLLVKDSALAEDIFQDTFIKVINTLKGGRYNEEGKFLPWVVRISRNLVIDHFRKEKRTPVVPNSDEYDIFDTLYFANENAEVQMIKQESVQRLHRLVQLLPDDQKEVLIMRYYGDMSFKEIAEITDVSINTALGRMRYALSNLRKMLYGPEKIRKTG